MSHYKDFQRLAKEQLIKEGYSSEQARRMSAMAVFSRLKREDGALVAESERFDLQRITRLRVDAKSFSVTESSDGGLVIEGALTTIGPVFDGSKKLWEWTEQGLKSVVDSINSKGIIGVADDHKGTLRRMGSRDSSESVLDWAQAELRNGQVWLKAKLKKGYEWVAKKFKGMSIEAKIPKDKFVNGKILAADPFAFTFTNNARKSTNRIHSIN